MMTQLNLHVMLSRFLANMLEVKMNQYTNTYTVGIVHFMTHVLITTRMLLIKQRHTATWPGSRNKLIY